MPKSQPADRDDHDREGSGGASPRRGVGGQEGWRQLTRYAGLAGELAVAVGIAVWLGVEADKRLKLSFPIFSWVVPLLVIVVMLVQLIKANSRRKK